MNISTLLGAASLTGALFSRVTSAGNQPKLVRVQQRATPGLLLCDGWRFGGRSKVSAVVLGPRKVGSCGSRAGAKPVDQQREREIKRGREGAADHFEWRPFVPVH